MPQPVVESSTRIFPPILKAMARARANPKPNPLDPVLRVQAEKTLKYFFAQMKLDTGPGIHTKNFYLSLIILFSVNRGVLERQSSFCTI